jgi:hypothetical protein
MSFFDHDNDGTIRCVQQLLRLPGPLQLLARGLQPPAPHTTTTPTQHAQRTPCAPHPAQNRSFDEFVLIVLALAVPEKDVEVRWALRA